MDSATKNFFLSLLVIASFWGCSEDISHKIATDLTKEAEQFFLVSEVIGENSYLGNLTFSDYFRLDTTSLPGCPILTFDSDLRTITLDYDAVESCEQTTLKERSGKILIDFSLANSDLETWIVTYQDYHYQKTKIEGSRIYKRLSTSQNAESFENLKITTSADLHFELKGSFTYFISRFTFRPFAISYIGKMEGINPVGRDFTLTITEAKEQYINCYSEGWILPVVGKENWKVSRGDSEIAYQVSYEEAEDCDTQVKAVLPDGRIYSLTP